MVRFVSLHSLATSGTPELVITGIGITETYFRFQIPVTAENPCISVGYTGSCEPSLITGILQLPGISSQEIEFAVKTTDIVLTPMQVESKKMCAKTVA